jgi:hypothetical protein
MDDVPQTAARPRTLSAVCGRASQFLPAAKSTFDPEATAQVAIDECAGIIWAYPKAPILRAHLLALLSRRITAKVRWLLCEEPAGEPHCARWLRNLHAWLSARRHVRHALAVHQAAAREAVSKAAEFQEAT